jgi:hypothetical protein
MKGNKLKAMAIEQVGKFILLVVAIVLAVFVAMQFFPTASKGLESVANNIKKPFCCDLMKCKPAATQATTEPGGGFACTAFCWGVCDK